MSADNTHMLSAADRLAKQLRESIRRGTYPLGSRLPSERALESGTGFSRVTVRRALAILESERLVIRQHGRGTFVASPLHADTREGTSLLGIITYEREYYFEAMVQAASKWACQKGYAVATGVNVSEGEEDDLIRMLIKNRVKGVVFSPLGFSRAHYAVLVDAGIPVVFVDSVLSGVEEDYVGVDNHAGTVKAVRHLVALGHRRIGYLGHNRSEDVPCRPERLRGYRDAVRDAGLSVSDRWVIEASRWDDLGSLVEGLRAADCPTAFVTFNDVWAVHLLQTARDAGMKVPDTLSVTGFDDAVAGRANDIPITTVDVGLAAIGKVAIDRLIERVEHPNPGAFKQTVLIEPRLVVRQSTMAPHRT